MKVYGQRGVFGLDAFKGEPVNPYHQRTNVLAVDDETSGAGFIIIRAGEGPANVDDERWSWSQIGHVVLTPGEALALAEKLTALAKAKAEGQE